MENKTEALRNDSISMLREIDREDVQEYLNIIIAAVYKEVHNE